MPIYLSPDNAQHARQLRSYTSLLPYRATTTAPIRSLVRAAELQALRLREQVEQNPPMRKTEVLDVLSKLAQKRAVRFEKAIDTFDLLNDEIFCNGYRLDPTGAEQIEAMLRTPATVLHGAEPSIHRLRTIMRAVIPDVFTIEPLAFLLSCERYIAAWLQDPTARDTLTRNVLGSEERVLQSVVVARARGDALVDIAPFPTPVMELLQGRHARMNGIDLHSPLWEDIPVSQRIPLSQYIRAAEFPRQMTRNLAHANCVWIGDLCRMNEEECRLAVSGLWLRNLVHARKRLGEYGLDLGMAIPHWDALTTSARLAMMGEQVAV